MKRNIFFSLLAVVALTFAACSNDDNPSVDYSKYKFIGTWGADSICQDVKYPFDSVRACAADTFSITLSKDGTCQATLFKRTVTGKFTNIVGDSTKFYVFLPDSTGKTVSCKLSVGTVSGVDTVAMNNVSSIAGTRATWVFRHFKKK